MPHKQRQTIQRNPAWWMQSQSALQLPSLLFVVRALHRINHLASSLACSLMDANESQASYKQSVDSKCTIILCSQPTIWTTHKAMMFDPVLFESFHPDSVRCQRPVMMGLQLIGTSSNIFFRTTIRFFIIATRIWKKMRSQKWSTSFSLK